jgi:hypothetical protein
LREYALIIRLPRASTLAGGDEDKSYDNSGKLAEVDRILDKEGFLALDLYRLYCILAMIFW